MKRDMDLIRKILQEVEGQKVIADGVYELYSAHAPHAAYQIALMKDAGFVDAQIDHTNGTPSAATIYRLTWAGHDFLDASRNNKLWDLAKEHVIKPGASWTFSILLKWLQQEASRQLLGDSSNGP